SRKHRGSGGEQDDRVRADTGGGIVAARDLGGSAPKAGRIARTLGPARLDGHDRADWARVGGRVTGRCPGRLRPGVLLNLERGVRDPELGLDELELVDHLRDRPEAVLGLLRYLGPEHLLE